MKEPKQEELIIKARSLKLIPKDVCKSWQFLAFKRAIPQACDTPWLIGLTEGPTFSKKIFKWLTCYQISTKSFKHSNLHIVGSFKGWLYLQYYFDDSIQLLNPFSNILIDLPPLSTAQNSIPSDKSLSLINESIQHAKAFALSFCRFMRPTMIVVVSSNGNLALCKIGSNTWQAHHQDEQYINMIFYNLKLYAMRREFKKIDIFEIADDLKLSLVGVIDSSQVINASLVLSPPSQAYLMVESKGNNLFLVMQYRHMDGFVTKTLEFLTFKVEDGDQLKKVDTLSLCY